MSVDRSLKESLTAGGTCKISAKLYFKQEPPIAGVTMSINSLLPSAQ